MSILHGVAFLWIAVVALIAWSTISELLSAHKVITSPQDDVSRD